MYACKFRSITFTVVGMKTARESFVLVAVLFFCATPVRAQLVAFGASNVSGWGVAASQAFPAQLQVLLRAAGYPLKVINAGVYGNSTAQMLGRVDSDIPPGTKIVLLDTTGGLYNDRTKGISPAQGRANMDAIAARLKTRGITIIEENAAEFAPQLRQADGVHLTAEGHKLLAQDLLPRVEAALGPPPPPVAAELVEACAADAKRLCPGTTRGSDERRACFHDHRRELSVDCRNAIIKSRGQ